MTRNFMEEALQRCVRHNPQGVFLVYGDQRVTWQALNERASRLASALAALGVGPGDRVVLMFHNCPAFFEANYAVQKLGAIPVPMNYRFTAREIAYQTNHCQAKAFLFERLWMDAVAGARDQMPTVTHYIGLDTPEFPDALEYEALMTRNGIGFPVGPANLEDTCVLCYTGGTTGLPKGVMLTYGNHVRMVQSIVRTVVTQLGHLQVTPDLEAMLRSRLPGPAVRLIQSWAVRYVLGRRWLQQGIIRLADRLIGSALAVRLGARQPIKAMMPSFPMFHDAAYQLAVLAPLLGNMTLVMPRTVSFDPEAVLKLVEQERPVLLGNVPTAWRMLVDYAGVERFDRSSVLACATGAGVCPAALKRKIFAAFPGVVIADGFGQTEMAPVTSFRFDFSPATIKDHCVGKPVVETRVVDEQDRDVKRGEIGEIIYRSGSVMKGYFNEPDKTAETVRDGWLYSGDLGYFDTDGDLRVVERKKECISSGGEKIFPHEVEEILLDHPDIHQVCVIGVPDEKWGQSVRAVVVLKSGAQLTAEAVIAHCEDRMAGYKKPRSVIFASSLPISLVGKVQRREVKESFGSVQLSASAGA